MGTFARRVKTASGATAVAEPFFSSLQWEVLSRHEFKSTGQAQAVVLDWCYGFYNHEPPPPEVSNGLCK